jgi:hypothetical protein
MVERGKKLSDVKSHNTRFETLRPLCFDEVSEE